MRMAHGNVAEELAFILFSAYKACFEIMRFTAKVESLDNLAHQGHHAACERALPDKQRRRKVVDREGRRCVCEL